MKSQKKLQIYYETQCGLFGLIIRLMKARSWKYYFQDKIWRVKKFWLMKNEIKSKVDIYTSEKGYTTENEFYRNSNIPTKEVFFTTADNRSKIETIFLEKGIDILKKCKRE